MTKQEIIQAHYRSIGRKGGLSKSKRKLESVKRNLMKAWEKRKKK